MKVSIVIPTHNNEKTIGKCLESLVKQTYPKDHVEILTVDDSTDSTPLIARDHGVKILFSQGSAPAKRNKGVKHAIGEIIGFIDSDAIAEKTWINKAVQAFLINKKVAVVGGPNLTPPNSRFSEKCAGFVFSSRFGSASMAGRYSPAKVFKKADETDLILCNMFIRKDVFLEVDGFSEEQYPNEENELCHKLIERGYELLYLPDLIVWHHRHPLFWPFLKQVYRYGWGRGLLGFKHFDALKLIHLIPSIFVFGILMGFIFGLINKAFLMIYFSCLAAYFIVSFVYSLKVSIKEENPLLVFIMPVAFFLNHVSYGLGFIKGFKDGWYSVGPFGYIPDYRNKCLLIDAFLQLFGYPLFFRKVQARSIYDMAGSIKNRLVVDLGCGDGLFLLDMVKRGCKSIIGVEISKTALLKAKERMVKMMYNDYVSLVLCDIEYLPFKSGLFELAICNCVLEHVRDDQKALVESARVLKIKGLFVATVPCDKPRIVLPFFVNLKRYYKLRRDFFKELRGYSVKEVYDKMIESGLTPIHHVYNVRLFGAALKDILCGFELIKFKVIVALLSFIVYPLILFDYLIARNMPGEEIAVLGVAKR